MPLFLPQSYQYGFVNAGDTLFQPETFKSAVNYLCCQFLLHAGHVALTDTRLHRSCGLHAVVSILNLYYNI